MTQWNDNQPIFRQLADQIIAQIQQGIWQEEQALPSIRSVAADLKINHLTVMKSYQLLVDDGLVEKRRGQGMFVAKGAVEQLKQVSREAFLNERIPEIATTLQNIDMSIDDFVQQLTLYMKDK
ncbi:GntR family transcriptional regulator [Vibrio sp. 99-70-13A1]|uniref:GntR family transcriptional regulator n=1 Tax=Vibrio sp. 99-70-13A1 TaxID=2607601 RepID=UPI0014936A56|nr:GntR family transcriptional regulator [Vibrio sp. 99-70-13A1]NOH98230.1 GntR family transcriptional regulator [Vibrio sp. 99-70-13A1]